MNKVKVLTPALKQYDFMSNSDYDKVIKKYISELEKDLFRIEQVELWKKENTDQSLLEPLKQLTIKVLSLQRLNRGVIFIAYGSNKKMNDLLSKMLD